MIREILKKYENNQEYDLYQNYLNLIEEVYYKSEMVSKIKLGDFEYLVKNKKLIHVEKISFPFSKKYILLEEYFKRLKSEKEIHFSMIYIDSFPVLELKEMMKISDIYTDQLQSDQFLISFGTKISRSDELILYLFSN